MTRRAQDEVDLTYITPRTIAMSFPATGYEVAYRNDIDDVAALLRRNHGVQHYAVWNLTERGYDYAKLDSTVRETGWPDHHAPPMVLLFSILLSLEDWLEADDRNVVVLHCLAGKGRTGLVIACQLFYTAQCSSMRAALRLFAERRSKTAKGVRQLSQLRYAYYLERALTSPVQLRERRLRLVAITMRGAPAFEQYYTPSSASYVLGCAPLVEVYRYFPPMSPENAAGVAAADAAHHPAPGGARDNSNGGGGGGGVGKLGHAFRLVYTDCQLGYRPKRQFTLFDESLTLPLDTVVQGDVLIKVLHHKERAMFNNRVEMFHCQISTMFVDEVDPVTHRLVLTLPKAELNEAQNNSKFANSFKITLEFEDLDAPAPAPPKSPRAAAAADAEPAARSHSPLTAARESPPLEQAPPLHPLQQHADTDVNAAAAAATTTTAAARVRPRRAEAVARGAPSYAEMPLDQSLALMRMRFRERQRARAAAQAAAVGSDSDDGAEQSAEASTAPRRRHVDASTVPPVAPLVVPPAPVHAAAPPPAIVIDVDSPRRQSEDTVLLAMNRSLSSDPLLRSLQVPPVGDQATLALDLAAGRGALSMSHDGAFEAHVDNTLKRSSDETVNLRRSRNRAQHSIGPAPASCELCQEAPAVAKLMLADGNGVLACQSCSESRLVSRVDTDDDDDDDDDAADSSLEARPSPAVSTTVLVDAAPDARSPARAMSFIDLGGSQQ